MPSTPPADRYEGALDQHLARQSNASAAERGADGELVLTRRAAGDQQVGDVDAGNQQQEADGAEQREQRQADVVDQPIGEQFGADADGAVGVRVLAFQRGGDRLQLAAGRLEADAGLQTAEGVESVVVAAIDQVGCTRDRADRREQIVRAHVLEIARHHADDGVLDAVQLHRPPDHGGIGAELRAPVRIADNHRGNGGGPVVFVGEAAAARRRHAEHVKEVARDPAAAQPLRALGAGQRVGLLARIGERLEGLRPRAPVEEVRPRDGDAVALAVDLVRVDEPAGVGQRQRLQQDAVHQRKDRRRRADAEGERHQDDQRERRCLGVRPDRIAHVVPQIVEKHGCSDRRPRPARVCGFRG